MAEAAETFLVVVDDTPEGRKALRYAAMRARRTGASVKLVSVLKPTQFVQWGGVQQAMQAEAEDQARAMLEADARQVADWTGERPETELVRGQATTTLLEAIRADRSIRALVLGAAPRGQPGPLVDFFSGEHAGGLPCMVIIVPGGIADADLDRLT
jgi:nucleotide-binding universal stress UspA family protein